MDEKLLYIKVTIENTISTTNEIIVISSDSETDDDATKCRSIPVTDDKIIVISDEEVLDGETTKPSPSLINNAQLAISAKKTDDDSGASGQVSIRNEQPRSSFLSTLLTEEELKLREPLPASSESDEYDAELEQQTVARVKRLTKKRRVQVSVSDITINIEKKLKVILE